MKDIKSGFILNTNYKTYYEIYGDISNEWNVPILIINGGPGVSHIYMKILVSLMHYIGPIIFYDQIGCGRSKSNTHISKFKLKDYVSQISNLLKHHNIKKCHLLGHSWGTILALEYYLKYQTKVMSIIFYSPCISIKLWQRQADEYVKIIKKKCKTCNLEDKYTKKHITDMSIATELIDTNSSIYEYLWGESEYNVSGYVKNYNKVAKLQTINVPTHYIGGKNDTASPKIIKFLSSKTPNSTYKIFNNSKHMAHMEETTEFFKNILLFFNYVYENEINKKYNIPLTKLLKNKKKDDTTLSIKLIVCTILNNTNKKLWNNNKLNLVLKDIISQIDVTKYNPKTLFDFQSVLDYWYYSKLFGYKNKYKPNDNIIKSFVTDKKIKNIRKSYDAVLMYIYIRSLVYCDPKKYKHFLKHIPLLKKKAQSNNIDYAYYLTHVILYDFKFGQSKTILDTSNQALKELYIFCKDNLIYNNPKNVDIMAEILLCCKLCNSYIFPYYSKIIRNIISKKTYTDYHENAVIVSSSLPFDNFKKFHKVFSDK